VELIRVAVLAAVCLSAAFAANSTLSVNPGSLPTVSQVDERFQAYNIEMLEVTGGRFWRPYKDLQPASSAKSDMDRLYEYRPPIDLSNARLRMLAAALGPSYVRVSGTWANSTYFQNSDAPAPATPPEGFKGVLTRKQWKGVIDSRGL
jgi:heparanase